MQYIAANLERFSYTFPINLTRSNAESASTKTRRRERFLPLRANDYLQQIAKQLSLYIPFANLKIRRHKYPLVKWMNKLPKEC